MAFRTVVISSRCKLEYSLNYLICRSDVETRVCLDEISTLIIQNVGVALTAALLSELEKKNVKVIFCDSKSNPQAELVPYYGAYNNYEKILIQQSWDNTVKALLWQRIIQEKIKSESRNLEYLLSVIQEESLKRAVGEKLARVRQYEEDVQKGDATNREGLAAKEYFSGCFGASFSRSDFSDTNMFLNYGYSIVLSAINRYLKALGYLTEVGVHHIGGENPFNLSCDFLEPFRAYVDFLVLSKKVDKTNFKDRLIAILTDQVNYRGQKMFFDNALSLYVRDALISLKEGNPSKMQFISYELN